MKCREFLNMKNGYTLEILHEHAGDDKESGLIEVPDGADAAVSYENLEYILFYKSESKEYFNTDSKGWKESRRDHKEGNLIWQRPTQPEELPFIDDEVNQPSHYTSHPSGIECIDAIEAGMSEEMFEGYLKGCCNKYLWRYKMKGGSESLRKAQWYLDRLIKLNEKIESRK